MGNEQWAMDINDIIDDTMYSSRRSYREKRKKSYQGKKNMDRSVDDGRLPKRTGRHHCSDTIIRHITHDTPKPHIFPYIGAIYGR